MVILKCAWGTVNSVNALHLGLCSTLNALILYCVESDRQASVVGKCSIELGEVQGCMFELQLCVFDF